MSKLHPENGDGHVPGVGQAGAQVPALPQTVPLEQLLSWVQLNSQYALAMQAPLQLALVQAAPWATLHVPPVEQDPLTH